MTTQMTWITDAAFSVSNAEIFEADLEAKVSALQKEMTDLDARADRIRNDRDLSREGMEKRLAELYSEKAAFLSQFEQETLAKLHEAEQGQRNAMWSALDSHRFTTGDKSADEIRAVELRRWFMEVDPAHRENVYLEAVRSGDRELAQAIENAPRAFNLLPQSLVLEGQRQRAAKLRPDEAHMQADLSQLRQVMGHNFARAKKVLEPFKQVAIRAMPEIHDPMFRMAKGLR